MLIITSSIELKAFAHTRLSKEEKVKNITEKMAQKLSLSEEKRKLSQNAVPKWRSDLKQILTSEQLQKLRI